MSNMAYCRFQNTLRDLRDCYDELWADDLSPEEAQARKQLIELCQGIADEVEENG